MSTDPGVGSGSARAGERDWLSRLGTLPVAAAVLTGILALYYFLVAITNVTDFGTNQAFVHHVLEMDDTFNDKHLMWRAIKSDGLQNVAYVGVIIWEWLITAMLAWATFEWIRAISRGGPYDRARRLATIGIIMIFILFVGGFITIGGEWFSMWQSATWNGLNTAFRNATLAALALLIMHLPSADWGRNR